MTESFIDQFTGRVANGVSKAFNRQNPILEAETASLRITIVHESVCMSGRSICIRKSLPYVRLDERQMIADAYCSKEVLDLLLHCVEEHKNIVVVGEPGAGKTELCKFLSGFIPRDERVITIEDSAELQMKSVANLVRLEAREATMEGRLEVSIRDLVKTSLRMRPDRIIVGEVRGGEAMDMLQALNTGHEGSLGTAHANSCRDMLARLEIMTLMSEMDLPLQAVRRQIASGVDILIHLGRMRDKSRKLLEVAEVCGYENGEIKLQSLYQWQEGCGLVQLAYLMHKEKLEHAGVTL